MAVWAGAEAAVKLHIARGDDPNARDEAGLTPLMIAATRNKPAICRLLVNAGAGVTALDPSGRNAFEIAIASGALEAAAVIELALRQQAQLVAPLIPPSHMAALKPPVAMPAEEAPISGPPERARRVPATSANELAVEAPSSVPVTSPQVPAEPAAPRFAVDRRPSQPDFEDDGEPLDLSGWEAEKESAPPIDDRPAAIAHVATQEAIGRHVALDDSADWGDFEADLPFHAAPLLRTQDAEGRIEVRALLLRASREGSVPEQAIEAVCRDADGARNQVTEALLGVVINDMGAESDERFECRSPFDSSEAFLDPEESAAESEAVDEALAFLDNLRSRHNEPIRLYMREAQRTVLLSAEEEAGLGREMDRAADAAIDALSRWHVGVKWLQLAIASARRGERSINSIVSSPRETAEPVDAAGLEELAAAETIRLVGSPEPTAHHEDEEGELGPTVDAEAIDAFALADELARLIGNGVKGFESQICATLALLSVRRSFLIRLCDSAKDGSAEGAVYARAIRSLMVPRDRMVRANLRLVISLAKRYMYSGVPMDDLIQDGNIGLVNAVDKFDWRRGFRFSTMATWWIRQQISRSIADSSLAIRLPVHVYEIAQRFPREAEAFEKRTGRPPTIQQLAILVGHDWRKVETLLRASSAPLPIESLDDESDLDASKDPDAFEAISATEMRGTLEKLLAELGAKPEKVVRLRFGMDTEEPQTLEEIGALFDVTRERIRQIESKALTKLKHPTRLARLRQWSLDPEKDPPSELADPSDDGESKTLTARSVAHLPRVRGTRAPTVAQTEDGKRLSPVEQVLRQAALLEIPVEQTARGEETTIWVSLTKAIDNRHRKLIRSLMAVGFEYWPGKGYWR
jgi:RNA polymerase primary sigma factor